MTLSHNDALAVCGFEQSGGKWRKQLEYTDPDGSTYTLFQIDGRVGWSIDIEKDGDVKTEAVKRMRGNPVYQCIRDVFQQIEEAKENGKIEPKEPTEKDPIENLKDSGFNFEPELKEDLRRESFEEPELEVGEIEDKEDHKACEKYDIDLLIKQVDAVLKCSKGDKTYGVVNA